MKLLLTFCVACALLYKAESLRCHVCTDDRCTNSTSVTCPATSTVCRTVTSVRTTGLTATLTVNKNCSTLLSCLTPLSIETEWSVNRGFEKEGHTQICCVTDNCNRQTLAIPNLLTNGKQCPACSSLADSQARTCNATLSCVGVEDTCFNGTTTVNSTEALQLGCMSNNLCSLQVFLETVFDGNPRITCGAPWSVRISATLLTFALIVHKVLV
uniref:protein RoBo-1-like n=1 Tax=Scatophagus argus TaxID=75038 RepID=UPI001ED85F0A|nr:protein RoBo-1-like [Scatophagus argus]